MLGANPTSKALPTALSLQSGDVSQTSSLPQTVDSCTLHPGAHAWPEVSAVYAVKVSDPCWTLQQTHLGMCDAPNSHGCNLGRAESVTETPTHPQVRLDLSDNLAATQPRCSVIVCASMQYHALFDRTGLLLPFAHSQVFISICCFVCVVCYLHCLLCTCGLLGYICFSISSHPTLICHAALSQATHHRNLLLDALKPRHLL